MNDRWSIAITDKKIFIKNILPFCEAARVFRLLICSLFSLSSRRDSNSSLSQSHGGNTILLSRNSFSKLISSLRSAALYALQ